MTCAVCPSPPLELELRISRCWRPRRVGSCGRRSSVIWAYPIELRIYEEKQRARLLAAQRECELPKTTNEDVDWWQAQPRAVTRSGQAATCSGRGLFVVNGWLVSPPKQTIRWPVAGGCW